MRPLLCLLVLLGLAVSCSAEAYEYDYSYDGSYGDDTLNYLDDYGYYGNDDDAYYEEFGTYSDSSYDFGYDDYDYLDYGTSSSTSSCTDKDGKVKLTNGTATCDLKLSGADKAADKLKSGLDGVYKLSGCHNGKPMYKRKDSPAGEERVLWYAKRFADWDISRGDTPNEKDILAYGTDAQQHVVPLFAQSWHLGADLTTKKPNGTSDETYVPVKLTVACADGKKVKPPPAPAAQKVGPILTDDEMELKYKMIYEKYGRRPEPNPTMNFSFVIMLVMVGLTVVLAIPYMLVKRGQARSKGYAPVATSFAQVIQQSKKKQSGHIH
jgi:iron-regulated transporter 1